MSNYYSIEHKFPWKHNCFKDYFFTTKDFATLFLSLIATKHGFQSDVYVIVEIVNPIIYDNLKDPLQRFEYENYIVSGIPKQ